ncbi:MAG: hypothetical protein JWO52_7295 [Gammaproteobacteria bacterium]|jgi:uncharacterized membrane protein YkoI|nr:hypothetical protein [Gammaproteobacteria bacterium]
MQTLRSNLALLLLFLGTLAANPPSSGRDAEPIVPTGALAHAAAALEKSTGGRVLEVRVANKAGTPAFEAAIARHDAVLYMRIEAPGDNVTEIKATDLPPWLLNYHMEAYIRSISKTEVPIDQAIMKAEARDNAPAIDAGIAKPLSGTNAVLAYFVETMKGSTRHESAVDATTGAFIANPDELYEAHTPVDLARRLAPH